MVEKKKPLKLTGRAFWTFLQPENPAPAYNEGEFEWGLDVTIEDAAREAMLRDAGLGPKIKNKGDDRGDFLTFRRSTKKKGGPDRGDDNNPIPVLGPDGKPWDTDILIANGSEVQVTFNVYQSSYRGKLLDPKPALLEVKVLKHIEYVVREDAHKPEKAEPRVKVDANQEEFN